MKAIFKRLEQSCWELSLLCHLQPVQSHFWMISTRMSTILLMLIPNLLFLTLYLGLLKMLLEVT